ncbi:MAG: DUF177 domain-containing protein [bacterium]|nr:DUF177 domain-containing protein [bacterium]
MKIHVDRLTQTPTVDVFEAPASWWHERAVGQQEPPYEILGPFRFEVASYKVGGELILEASVQGEIEVQCGRCLARYRHALREEFRLVAEEAQGRVPPDPEGCESLAREGLCLTDEIELGWYQGTVIRLDGVLGELVAAAIPLHPVCREDCKGLCERCGVSRNETSCDCEPLEEGADKTSPFAVLAQLNKRS